MLVQRSCHAFVLAFMFLAFASLSAQRGSDLPRPDSSRPPLLTRTSSDSVRFQTASLHLGSLLQVLQAGDGPTLNAVLKDADLGSATCLSPAEALAKASTRARRIRRSDGGTSLAFFFDKIKVVDSGTAQAVTMDFVIVPAASNQPTRDSVTLALDPLRGVWIDAADLLKVLCDL